MNNITVNNYIETILNPTGRFKTLNVKAKLDQEGDPILHTKSGVVSFEVSVANVDYLLKCFTNRDIISYSRARLIAQHTHIKQFKNLTSYQYLYREMLVFNSIDQYDYVDIVLEEVPKGVNLIDKMFDLQRLRDYDTARIIVKNIFDMFNWMQDFGVTHNNIKPQNITIDNNLNPILINYDLAVKSRSYSDFQAMATLGVTLLTTICTEKEIYSIQDIKRNYKEVSRKVVSTIANATLDDELDLVKDLTNSIVDSSSKIEDWNYLYATLANIANNLKRHQSIELAFETHKISNSEPKVDISEQYDYIGSLSDNMIRVERGGKWQYINYNGDVVINSSFDMAYDFIESRAAVAIADKWGIIDQNGAFITPPIHDDITWDGDSNVIIVSNGGFMGLINRSGQIVAPLIYDSINTGSDGCLLAQTNYYYGYLHPDGSVAIEFKYDTASSFRNGVAAVEIGDEKFFIDTDGNRV